MKRRQSKFEKEIEYIKKLKLSKETEEFYIYLLGDSKNERKSNKFKN